MLGVSAPVPAQTELPDFGDVSSATLSPIEERRLGEAFMREVRARVSPSSTTRTSRSTWNRWGVVSRPQATLPDSPFTSSWWLRTTSTPLPDPGGYIGINAGLIMNTDSEGELASVIAHEMAHVTQRHIARRFEQQERSSIPVFAGIVAAVVLGTQSPDLGQAAAAAALGSAVQTTLNFSREAEQEADRVGLQSLVRAGYDPRAMPAFLESCNRRSATPERRRSISPPTPSPRPASRTCRPGRSSPPGPGTRTACAISWSRRSWRCCRGKILTPALEFFEDSLEHGEHENVSAAAYGLGLALARTGAHDEARKVFEALVERHPEELSIRIAAAENEFAAGRVSKSMELYEEAYERHPSSRALVLAFAEALVQSRRSDEALELIDTYSRSHGTDLRLHRLAAEAYAQRGERPAAASRSPSTTTSSDSSMPPSTNCSSRHRIGTPATTSFPGWRRGSRSSRRNGGLRSRPGA